MSKELWEVAAHAAAHDDSKAAGLILIVVGFFLAPFLIGIPLMIWGASKLCK
jgi:hypothetical protein